jgi:hypothetical protein
MWQNSAVCEIMWQNSAVCEIMWQNNVESDTPRITIWRIRMPTGHLRLETLTQNM